MSLLTDEELWALVPNADNLNDAKAVQAALLAKLASAELPEPAGRVMAERNGFVRGRLYRIEDRVDGKPLYTADQLTAWGNTRYAQGAAAQLSAEPVATALADITNTGYIHVGHAAPIKFGTELYTRREPK